MNKRLQDIITLIDKAKSMADIGTDHAYLPIYLVKNNIVEKAYACDIAKGPLSKAKENIKAYKLEDKIETILTDGLKGLSEDIDEIVIAGMGGDLIVNILSSSKYNYKTLVLQPNLHSEKVREYLYTHNYKIIDEKVSYDNKKYYDIIKATIGIQSLTSLEISYGPINLIKKEETFINKLEEKLNTYKNIASNFNGNSSDLKVIEDNIINIENIIKNESD